MKARVLLTILIMLLFLSIPFVANAEEEVSVKVNSFELFWPLSAGKVTGENFYFLKQIKENVRASFIFGDFNKAKYYITLSEKRLLEAEKSMILKKDIEGAKKAFNRSEENLKAVVTIYGNSKSKPFSTDLKEEVSATVSKQMKLSNSLLLDANEEQKQLIDPYRTFLNNIVEQLQ